MGFKNTISIFVIILLFGSWNALNAQTEFEFYKAPAEFKITKNLVTDFKVDNDFATDDSRQFQLAIDNISDNGGGKLFVPKGNYSLREIQVKSNVHIVFDPDVVIRPKESSNNRMVNENKVKKNKEGQMKKNEGGEMNKNKEEKRRKRKAEKQKNKQGKKKKKDASKGKNYNIFSFGMKSQIENVSFTSSEKGKMFTIDLTQITNFNVCPFAVRNVDNFYFSGILIKDNQTKFSSFTLAIASDNGTYDSPRNGVIRNSTTTNADYGYGLIQAQAAKNVLFENIDGQGGVTLRCETGAKKMNDLQLGGLWDIVARNVSCRDGNAALMISPHAMKNGIVTIDGVTSVNCGFAVRIGNAYVAKKYDSTLDLEPGIFDPKSSVKNVTATFGTTAQVKPKHFKYIPSKYHTKEKTAETPITNVHSNPRSTKSSHAVFSVSVAAVGNFTGKDVACTSKNGNVKKFDAGYSIQVDESTVKAIGFGDQKPVIDATDDVLSDCKYVK